MKAATLFLSLLRLLGEAPADDSKPGVGRLPATCEIVMSPGMKIAATTSVGTIAITAVDELTRSYTWDGATRAVEIFPRSFRWYGNLGLYNPGAGEHWRDHHGITRCVTEEGQQHFKTVDEALKWIKERGWLPSVYRDDGLMVGWDKNLPRKQLTVEVWQILIDGKKPKRLPGSQNDKIVVQKVELDTVPLVKAVASNDLKAVTALLAKGADANVKNSAHIPVLMTAIRFGSVPIVEALLKNKANPNVRDIDTTHTPLLQAFDGADIDKMREIVKILLAAGADVNAESQNKGDLLMGVTPLMLAADVGREDLVQLLLDKGANVNAKARSGDTALSFAKSSGLKESKGVIRMLEAAAEKN